MPNVNSRAGRLMAAGFPPILTSPLLSRADQDLFGVPSDFWVGLFLGAGVVLILTGLAVAIRSYHANPR